MKTFIGDPFRSKSRRVLLACALLAVPACGLSDYEKLMQETQKREERFRGEKTYLDEPIKIPTRKDKEDHEVALAEAFFRPPKGIQSTGEEEPNKLFWRYRPGKSGSEFLQVELAFADDNNTFSDEVQRVYPRKGQTPQWTPPLPFDSWEYDEGQYTYTVNVSQTAPKVAIVFIVGKGRGAGLHKNMELSLQSLAVGPDAGKARQRYNRKSPWQLEPKATGGNP